MSIMSLAWFGTTVMTWKALDNASASSLRSALCEYLTIASRSMWYLVSLWIGFIRRSVSRSLNPSLSRISCNNSWLMAADKSPEWPFRMTINTSKYVSIYSDTMYSDLGLFWQYTTYIWNFRSYFLNRLPSSIGLSMHASKFFKKLLQKQQQKLVFLMNNLLDDQTSFGYEFSNLINSSLVKMTYSRCHS